MFTAILVLLLIALMLGVGIFAAAAKFLIWVALILFVVWLVGWAVGSASEAGRRGWYYW